MHNSASTLLSRPACTFYKRMESAPYCPPEGVRPIRQVRGWVKRCAEIHGAGVPLSASQQGHGRYMHPLRIRRYISCLRIGLIKSSWSGLVSKTKERHHSQFCIRNSYPATERIGLCWSNEESMNARTLSMERQAPSDRPIHDSGKPTARALKEPWSEC